MTTEPKHTPGPWILSGGQEVKGMRKTVIFIALFASIVAVAWIEGNDMHLCGDSLPCLRAHNMR